MIPALVLVLAQAAPVDTLAADTWAEAYALSTEVTGLEAEAKRYEGARFMAQAGFGRTGVAVRADLMGLPAEFDRTKPQTYRSAEAYVVAHRNMANVAKLTCGPAVTAGYALSLDKLQPSFPKTFTAGLGGQCANEGRTVLAFVGQYQSLPGVSVMAAVIWPISKNISWMADFAVGARNQRVARISIAVLVGRWQ